ASTSPPVPDRCHTASARSGVAAKFPVIPVQSGIFPIVLAKCRSGTENGEANQSFAGQFSLPAKREFIRVQSGIRYAEPGIRSKNRSRGRRAAKHNDKKTHRSLPSKSNKIRMMQ